MACTAGASAVVPMARPVKIRLPVITLVNAPPMAIRVTASTQPLAKVSRPTRCRWRGWPGSSEIGVLRSGRRGGPRTAGPRRSCSWAWTTLPDHPRRGQVASASKGGSSPAISATAAGARPLASVRSRTSRAGSLSRCFWTNRRGLRSSRSKSPNSGPRPSRRSDLAPSAIRRSSRRAPPALAAIFGSSLGPNTTSAITARISSLGRERSNTGISRRNAGAASHYRIVSLRWHCVPPEPPPGPIAVSRSTRTVTRWCWRWCCQSGAGVQLAVDPVRVEPARGGRLGGQVDDVQHLARGAAEGQPVGVGRHDVGLAAHGHALVVVAGAVQAVPGGGDGVGVLGQAAVVQHGPDVGGVVGLDGQDARGRPEVGLVADQRGRTLVRGDADVLEDEGAEQEVVLVGVDVEGLSLLDQARGGGRGRERRVDVDLGLRHGGAAQRGTQERHVLALVLGDLGGELADIAALERDLVAALYRAVRALARGEAGGQAVAVDGVGVELGFQVLQVQCEVQDRAIGDRVAVGGGGSAGGFHAGQQAGAHQPQPGRARGLQETPPVGRILGTAVDQVCYVILSEHRGPPLGVGGCHGAFGAWW